MLLDRTDRPAPTEPTSLPGRIGQHYDHGKHLCSGNPEAVQAAVNATTNQILGLKDEQKKAESPGSEANVPNCSLVESSEAA
jgi:hypothetical protein